MALGPLGLLIGMAAGVALTRLMEHLLYGVSATDAATLASVALALLLIALVASYFAARRATRVDPMVAMRG